MKAWILHNIGDIRFEDTDRPEPGPGEVLVRVKAAGICGSDIPRIYDTGAHKMPLILGHEFSGIVDEPGQGADPSWLNKRVGIFPLIPCRKCEQCLNGRYELCRNYDYLGSRSNGGFAEYVTVPQDNLIELPDAVSFEEAAMLEPMSVAVHAIRRVTDIDNGDRNIRVAVYGLGTIGLFITMFLKGAGYENLILIGNKESQKDMIVSMGISERSYMEGTASDIATRIASEGGADVVFECVGKMETYAASVDMAAPMGRVMLVGNPYSDMTLSRGTYWKILRNQLTVTGTWNSSFTGKPDDDWHYVLRLLEEKRIDPTGFITHSFTLEGLERGLDIMRDKSEEYMKVMALF